MTSNSPAVKPLGLADALRRAEPRGQLRIVAHNGASLVGGAEHALIRLLRGLQQRGHQVTLCCNHEVVADEAARRLIPAIVLPLRGDLMIADALRFAKFLRTEPPDAVLLGTFKKIWLGGLAASRAGITHTVARVGLGSDTPRRLKYRIALRRFVNLVVLNASSMRERFLAGASGLDPDRVITIYNGVTPPKRALRDSALRKSLRIGGDVRVIGAVARLSKQKRVDRLIELTARLRDVHCIVAGDGTRRAALEAQAEKLGITDRVHLIGAVNEVGDVLAALDLFVVCSDQEGMSNAMLEALWAGVPVVSTPVDGAHEALEPMSGGQAPGRVTADFSVDTLVANVGELLQNNGELRRMSVAAEARARERFEFERMVGEWEQALRGDKR